MMLQVQDLGVSSYKNTWELQKKLQIKRIENKIEDTLLLVEHEPVYTFGKRVKQPKKSMPASGLSASKNSTELSQKSNITNRC